MKEAPLVLIHGYPFDHTMWFSVIAAIGSGIKVLAPDLPGFGRVPVLESKPSLEGYADYIAGLLDANGSEKAAVAGMSMGGLVALAFAEKYPQRVVGLGLISSQAAADSDEVRKSRKEMVKKINAEGPLAGAQAVIPKMFSPSQANAVELSVFPQEGAEKAGAAGLTWALQAMAGRPDRTEIAKGLDVPVLVAHGMDDKIVPYEKARPLAELCRRPLFVEVRGAGHATPLEAPDLIAQGLVKLMARARALEEERSQANPSLPV